MPSNVPVEVWKQMTSTPIDMAYRILELEFALRELVAVAGSGPGFFDKVEQAKRILEKE